MMLRLRMMLSEGRSVLGISIDISVRLAKEEEPKRESNGGGEAGINENAPPYQGLLAKLRKTRCNHRRCTNANEDADKPCRKIRSQNVEGRCLATASREGCGQQKCGRDQRFERRFHVVFIRAYVVLEPRSGLRYGKRDLPPEGVIASARLHPPNSLEPMPFVRR
jgi:hypothetical protein